MTIYVNDEAKEIGQDKTVDDLLADYELSGRNGIAVAINDEVVPKDRWKQRSLQKADRVLLITASQGG